MSPVVTSRPLSGLTAAWLLARLTLRRLLHSRSMLVTLTFALLPIAYAFAARAEEESTPVRVWGNAFTIAVFLLAIGPPLHLAPAVAEEVEGKTYTYLWSRPFPRWALIVGKLIVLVPVLCVIFGVMLGAVFAACFQSETGAFVNTLANGVLAMSMGVAATSCVCVALGTLLSKHPIAVSVGYMFVLDAGLGGLPISLHSFSISYQVAQIAKVEDSPDPLAGAMLWCVGVAAIWLAVALWRVSRAEFSTDK